MTQAAIATTGEFHRHLDATEEKTGTDGHFSGFSRRSVEEKTGKGS
jgi:hypothetical protein